MPYCLVINLLPHHVKVHLWKRRTMEGGDVHLRTHGGASDPPVGQSIKFVWLVIAGPRPPLPPKTHPQSSRPSMNDLRFLSYTFIENLCNVAPSSVQTIKESRYHTFSNTFLSSPSIITQTPHLAHPRSSSSPALPCRLAFLQRGGKLGKGRVEVPDSLWRVRGANRREHT